ncbi:fimbrillin family protein [Bacteroidaceae bacterium HV4-6-C5C]|nr:fimbrillin family protein [Bacteroidaceae bacterium HV4-6-C5C]
MRIRYIIYTIVLLGLTFSFIGCQSENDSNMDGKEQTLSLSPTVQDMISQALTRSLNSFFYDGDQIDVNIITSRSATIQSFTYTYGAATNIFSGDFRFNLDNTSISKLEALWPSKDVRDEGLITDQRELKNYQKADRLKAEASTINIMPTAEPIPLAFKHEQSRLTFCLAGQNANGLIIKDLILELTYNSNKTAFWAYCKTDGTAELILPESVQIGPALADGGRMMVGLVTVAGATANSTYRGVIYIPNKTNIQTIASTDYLVTLTPEGYNLTASITIRGFSQDEGYVGIPIQMPKYNSATGKYEITSTLQLVTLSLLLKGGYIKDQDASVWRSYQYSLDSAVTMTDNGKQYYKPIDVALKGIFFDGVTAIKDAQNNDFNLFE